ncbi:MAG TPA: efflux RND transporter periplasmic adaptor subunit [Longimicrobiales bacterium]|nr:efflux RND transporter periplasmic adaptor subunit [Longimicrobiales bacterium]
MATLRNPRLIIPAIVLLVLGAGAFYRFAGASPEEDSALVATVKQDDLRVTVSTTGELRAREAVQVQGPAMAQVVNVYQTKISSIVPEGTEVEKGEVIAELDRGAVAAKLADVTLNLQKATAQYTSAQLDSALALAQAREDIRTADYALEEKKLAKEQSKYEAPTVQRQTEIDFERAQRQAAQARASYQTKLKQATAKMSEAAAERDRQANQLKVIQQVMDAFTVRAPSDGMVIYVREWNGRKKGVGSTWSPWDPTVATLPDLTQMESATYVNEVDVRKVAVGQKVRITLDSDPSKVLTGTVSSVANVGEQRPNQDSKVFEVKIVVAEADTTLRPGMTTANAIETAVIPNALYIPIEAVSADSGGSFVYKRDGGDLVKQQVVTGAMSDNEIVVLRGLEKGDQVLLAPPADAAGIRKSLLDGVQAAPPGKPTSPAEAPKPQATTPRGPAVRAEPAPAAKRP